MKIPDLLQEDFFLMLTVGSVHNCKQVSKEWCKFIMGMWKKKGCVKVFTFRIGDFQTIMHDDGRKSYKINNYTIHLPFDYFIETVSKDSVALKTWNNVPISNRRAAVYKGCNTEFLDLVFGNNYLHKVRSVLKSAHSEDFETVLDFQFWQSRS